MLRRSGRWTRHCRDPGDGERAHHHGGDRVGRAVAGVGDRAAGVGDRPRGAAGLLRHHLVLLQPTRRLLPRAAGPRPGQAELHLRTGRQVIPGYVRTSPAAQARRLNIQIHSNVFDSRQGSPSTGCARWRSTSTWWASPSATPSPRPSAWGTDSVSS
jgi:hypothetical protein